MPTSMSQGTVLITGASSGFGAACARHYASAGHPLILLARRLDELRRLKDKLKAHSEVHLLAVDVRDQDQLNVALCALPAPFADIEILINNAGLALGLSPAWEAHWDDWETMMDTNIKGLVYLTRQVLPGMVKRGRGHIVNIGSTAGAWPYPGANVYGATKAFVQQFSRNLRADLLGTPVRVSNIDPGLAETEFSKVRFKGDEDKARQVYAGTQPLRAEDVAEAIYWVTSRPAHVNINAMEIMPTDQAWGPVAVRRDGKD